MTHCSAYTGRLAPSPTGLLHLGHVRTFGVAWARAVRGVLRLRIDDLDPERSRAEYSEAAIEDLTWLGMGWQGEPVRQSGRTAEYRAAWARLVGAGWVYPCGCSRRELRGAAQAPHEGEQETAADGEPVYAGTCRPGWMTGAAQAPAGWAEGAADRERWTAEGPTGTNWRFRVPDGEVVSWEDGGFGRQRFVAGRDFGDFAVWRRDDVPAYQLATVVDDRDMGVTEVVRGADLLLSTARQMLVFRALGVEVPGWFHCGLVRDAEGRRLAKRTDALSVRALRARGLSPEDVLGMAGAAEG